MPSASAFLDEPQAPSASAFLDEAPVVSGGEGDGFLAKINAILGGKEGVSERPSRLGIEAGEAAPEGTPFVHGFGETASHMVPQSWGELGEFAGSFFPPLEAYRQTRQGIDIATGKPPEEVMPGITELKDLEDIKNQYGGDSPEYQAAAGKVAGNVLPQMIMAGLVGKGLDVPTPSHLRTEPLAPEPPPTQRMGPGTLAQDVSRALERRFTLQEPLPEPPLAPSPPIEETLPKIPGEPPVFNPELGPQTIPEFEMPLRTEGAQPMTLLERNGQILERRKGILARKAELTARAANGEQGLEPQLAAVEAELNDPVTNPVVHAPPVEVPVQHGEFAEPGYTALPTEPVAAPEPYTPEAAAARAAQPQAAIPPEDVKYAGGGPQTEVPGTVGISQARTEAELGPGSVVPGTGAEMGSGLAHGRDYINKGGDPRLPIRRANTSGMVGKNDVGIVHAELDRLRVERSKAAAALEANPADPVLQQNFSVADDAQRAWRKELQPVLTKASDALREAHAASMPDADVGTYQGLADLMDEHFKGERTLSPEERTALAKAAKGVKESRNIANGEMAKVETTLEKQVRARGKKVLTPEELEASIRNRLETEFTDCVLGA